jgi:hypothetical protein
MKTKIKILALGVALCIAACKGEDGAVGPTGPKGDTGLAGTNGTNGAVGATGPAGAVGATGTANVIYSAWIDRPFPGTGSTAWTSGNFGTATRANFPTYSCSLSAPKLTPEIIDKGVIMVYMKPFAAFIGALPLPHEASSINSIDSSPLGMRYSFTPLGNGTIVISAKNVYPALSSGTWQTPSTDEQFRYVIIPGGVPAGRTANVDLNDYEAVKKYYNLKD